mgnify:CR=1 FL=1
MTLDEAIEAANRLFGMLDPVQGAEIRALWDEFEAKETAESRYANAVDRLQPLLLNYMTNGHTWKEGDVHAPQIYKRMDIIRTTTPALWPIVEGIINTSIEIGILKQSRTYVCNIYSVFSSHSQSTRVGSHTHITIFKSSRIYF